MKLEGTNRNVGTHAAGVVIANGPITDYVPVQRVCMKGDKGDEDGDKADQVTTQWTMDDLEKVGMLKMDFLGLRTLTLLDKAVKLIEAASAELTSISASCRSTTKRLTNCCNAAKPRACSSLNRKASANLLTID